MIAQGLISLGFEPLVDFVVQDDGDGPYIREWLSDAAQPSAEEIEAAGPVVPDTVTPAQAKIALYEAGLLNEVEALVADHPYRPVSIWWTSALAFERGHAYLNALGLELGLTDAEIDALFIAAAKK